MTIDVKKKVIEWGAEYKRHESTEKGLWNYSGSPVVEIHLPMQGVWDPGCSPGRGTKISQASGQLSPHHN